MLDFLKFLPVIMQFVNMANKVKENLRTGGSVHDLLTQAGPGMLDIVKQIGSSFFPNVAGDEKQVQAAAMKVWDQDYVMGVQTNLNKVMSSGLAVDGDYGPKTKQAVTDFQTKFKVKVVDGWAGPVTNAALQTAATTALKPI